MLILNHTNLDKPWPVVLELVYDEKDFYSTELHKASELLVKEYRCTEKKPVGLGNCILRITTNKFYGVVYLSILALHDEVRKTGSFLTVQGLPDEEKSFLKELGLDVLPNLIIKYDEAILPQDTVREGERRA